MTYGRPTMTGHVPYLPLPETGELADREVSLQPRAASEDGPSKMCFYVEFIRQCRILGEILSNVYQPSTGGSVNAQSYLWSDHKTHGMDAILELDAKLSRYESAVRPAMSWRSPCDISGLDEERRNIIVTQRTVLHGRWAPVAGALLQPLLTPPWPASFTYDSCSTGRS